MYIYPRSPDILYWLNVVFLGVIHVQSALNGFIFCDSYGSLVVQCFALEASICTLKNRLVETTYRLVKCNGLSPSNTTLPPVLKQLHWLPVECRITYTLMVMVYKCVNGTAPAYLCRLIQPKCRDSRLRQPSDLELHRPVPKKAIGTAAFGFVGPDRWNKLPERLRESASLNIF